MASGTESDSEDEDGVGLLPFVVERAEGISAGMPAIATARDVLREAVARWRALGRDERARYDRAEAAERAARARRREASEASRRRREEREAKRRRLNRTGVRGPVPCFSWFVAAAAGEDEGPLPEWTARRAEAWNAMTDEEKEPWREMARKDVERYRRDMEAAAAAAGDAPAARRRGPAPRGQGGRKAVMSAYAYFTRARGGRVSAETLGERGRIVAAEWRALNPAGRRPFEAMAACDAASRRRRATPRALSVPAARRRAAKRPSVAAVVVDARRPAAAAVAAVPASPAPPPAPVRGWGPREVEQLLLAAKCARWAPLFRARGVTGRQLERLSDRALRDSLGVTSVSARAAILAAVAKAASRKR